MTKLETAAAAYLDAQRYEHGLAPDSVRLYRTLLNRFTAHAGPRRRISACQDAPAAFLSDLGHQGLSDHYRLKAFHVLQSFFRWGRAKNFLKTDPLDAVWAPIVNERPRVFLDRAQAMHLLNVIRADSGIHALRDHAALSCGFFAGLRIGEIVRLRPQDLNFATEEITVLGKGGKIRRVPMHPELSAILRDWTNARDNRAEWLFASRPQYGRKTGQLTRCRLQWLMRKRYGPRAGFGRGVTPHTLRRSFATRLRDAGVDIRDIQRLLGHAQLQTTISYLRDSPEGLREAVRKL